MKDLNLNFKYRTSANRIHEDFYLPCLKESHRYDRAVGYFTSHSLSILSRGLNEFLLNNGKIRIVANPHLSEEDFEAIEQGYKAREDLVVESLLKEIEKSDKEGNSLNTLSLLISRDQLDIKIAYPKTNGIYHEKFGLFKDKEGNVVAFSGSANETVGGLKKNFEKIDVYTDVREKFRVDDMIQDFEELWEDQTPFLDVIAIPNVVKNKIHESASKNGISVEKVIDPRPYQKEAIKAVIDNDWNGILEMATGTGKTYTALLAAREFLKEHKKIFLVIIVPFKHLIEQWIDNIEELDFKDITICSSDNSKWRNELHMKVRDYNSTLTDAPVVITTYHTAATEDFDNYMMGIRKYEFLIADECHYMGQNRMRNNKLGNFRGKIGLSATPERWFDDEGSSYISEFFNGTVYRYSLEKAIKNHFLTEYEYQPVVTGLTDLELEEYEDYTKRIIPLMHIKNPNKSQKDQLQSLYIQRSRIVKTAVSKKEKLIKLLLKENVEELKHVLVYCAEGQIDDITRSLSKIGYKVHRFDHRVSNIDRQKILTAFDQGEIQILVAINCLDEGVDVPATRTAYFLSSTSNPRQFIQRRGRVLRIIDGKYQAKIYDFITIPTQARTNTFKSIIKKEAPRISEFSEYATNKYESRKKLTPYLQRIDVDLTKLLDKNNLKRHQSEIDKEE